MGKRRWHKIIWTDEMLSFLKDNYHKMTNRQLADALGLEITSTRHKLYELGFKRIEMEYWSEAQVNFLKENYRKMGDTEIAELFNMLWHKDKGWTKKHIEKKRSYLKLKRTESEIFQILVRNIDQGRMQNCRWSESTKTSLQLPIGSIVTRTIQGYKTKLIKIRGGFVKLSRFNYEKKYGVIPEGMVIVMKDGNPLNCEPENLTLTTREQQAELMRDADRTIAFYLSISNKQSKKGKIRKETKLFEELLNRPDLLSLKRAELKLRRAIKNVS